MLSIEGLKVSYGHVEALKGIDLEVRQGNITAIIGSNGAGKTSTLMAISGLAPITAGDIRFEGQSITRCRPHDITRLGITQILEGRQCSQIRQSRITCCSAAILAYRVIARVSLR
jgi:branched-chain amino acid transport system ATP-binding protein